MGDVLAQPGFRGRAFLMASAELPAGERTRPVCDACRGWTRQLFVRLAEEAGAREADALAQQLVLLYDGALVSAQMDGNAAAAAAARSTAAALVDAAIGRRRR